MKKLTEKDIDECACVLLQGEVLAFPTETVYGLGVVYDDEKAFKKLVTLKNRAPNKPFALMCSSLQEAYKFIEIGPKAKAVMQNFLPGELTVLVKVKPGLPTWVTLGTDTIGIRVPASDFVLKTIGKVGKPCLVTSANRSGEPTLTTFNDVFNEFNEQVGGIVKGECNSLVPSTIVSLVDEDKIALVRQGPIDYAKIEKVWRTAK